MAQMISSSSTWQMEEELLLSSHSGGTKGPLICEVYTCAPKCFVYQNFEVDMWTAVALGYVA